MRNSARYLVGHGPLWWCAFFSWVAAIFWLSAQPSGPEVPMTIPHLDKMLHAFAFMVGSMLLCFALVNKPGFPLKTTRLIAVVTLSLYGVLDEIHQLSTPGRSGGDFGDMTADFVGAILGALLFSWLYERLR